MLRKLCLLIPLVLLVGMTSNAGAAVVHWTGTLSTAWTTPQNWDLGTVPGGGDDAAIDPTLAVYPHFTIAASNAQAMSLVSVGYNDKSGTLYMDSGRMYCNCGFVGTKNASKSAKSVAIMTGGTIYASGIHSTNGSEICNGGYFQWPRGDTAGAYASGTFTQSGGLVDIGTMDLPFTESTGTGIYNLDGGTLKVRWPYVATDAGHGLFIGENRNRNESRGATADGNSLSRLNITGGKLLIAGGPTKIDATALIARYVDVNHVIVPYPLASGNKYIVVDYDKRTDNYTTVTAVNSPASEAWNPNPINGDLFAVQSPTLTWSPGAGATGHDVYFGTATNPPLVRDQTSPDKALTSYTPIANPLILGKQYYWKIVEHPTSTGTEPTWTFTVTGRAKLPIPEDGASVDTKADKKVTLSWTAGSGATAHDVWYGTSTSSWTKIATAQPGTTKDVFPDMGKSYVWRVDEISPPGPVTTTGTTWSFSNANYRLIDDFEAYISDTNLRTTWPGAAAPMTVLLSTDSGTDNGPHHNGLKGMNLYYQFSGSNYIEEVGNYVTAQDWTESAVTALGLYMRGMGNNDSLSGLYIMLKDSGGDTSNKVYYSGPDGIVLSEDWVSWDIKMSDLTTGKPAFNLNAVQKVVIGLEDTTTVAEGVLYVDDIKLYPSRCVPTKELTGKAGSALADITNDCKVDNNDLDVISEAWLVSDSYVAPNGILMNDQTVGNGPTWGTGKFGGGVVLNGTGTKDWVDIDDLFIQNLTPPDNFYNKTIAFWVKTTTTATAGSISYLFGTSAEWRVNIIVRGLADPPNTQQVAAVIGSGKTAPADFGTTTIDTNWHHIALTLPYDSFTENIASAGLYVDGVVASFGNTDIYAPGSFDLAPIPYHDYLTGACIGALNNGLQGWVAATIDDFRIYGTVLSQSDINLLKDEDIGTNPSTPPLIMYNFNDGSGTSATNSGSMGTVYHPVGYVELPPNAVAISPAELDTSTTAAPDSKKRVNMKDYAKVAKHWLYGSAGEWVWP